MRKRPVILVSLVFGAALLVACAHMENLVKPVRYKTVRPSPSGVQATISAADFAQTLQEEDSVRALLLPFADYSAANYPKRHTLCHSILEAGLLKHLPKAGLNPVAYGSPVSDYLQQTGVVLEAGPILEKASPRTGVILWELETGEWSGKMSGRIGEIVHQNLIALQALEGEIHTTPLDRKAIQEIGAAWGVDYVVRGRITVFQSGFKWEDYPRPESVLAFYFPRPDQGAPFMGVSNLAAYERFGEVAMVPTPSSVRSEDNRPFKKHGDKITPIVRVDLFIQETGNGNVVYAESSETRSLKSYSVSHHGGSEPYEHIERAIDQAVDHALDPLT